MQAALMIRSQKRVARRKRLKKEGRLMDLPSNVSVKQLNPFPRYPPIIWVGDLDTSVKCAQGRAAWLERGRRCSVQENSASCHRRWVKRNRIHDSSLGGSSDDEDLLGVLRGPSSFANAFLYVGLGTVAIGLVIAFVGTGEKGFKTVELRLIGPSLIGIGLVCCILRILFCICPSHCISSNRRKLKKRNAKVDVDHTTSLLRDDSKRVSIARGPQPKYPLTSSTSSKTKVDHSQLNEGIEALRHIASTSIFLQNEKISKNRIVPIINEPEILQDTSYEMQKIDDMTIEILSISDEIDDNSNSDNNTTIKSNKINNNNSNNNNNNTNNNTNNNNNNNNNTNTNNNNNNNNNINSYDNNSYDNDNNNSNNNDQQNENLKLELQYNKLIKTRSPVNQTKQKDSDSSLMETSLSILNPSPILQSVRLKLNEDDEQQLNLPSTSTVYQHKKQQHEEQQSFSKLIQQSSHQEQKQQQSQLAIEPEIVLSPAKLGQ